MSAPLGPDDLSLTLADGEPHAVCSNVIVFEARRFVVTYRTDVRGRVSEGFDSPRSRNDAIVFLSMSAFGFAALATVFAFLLMLERVAI